MEDLLSEEEFLVPVTYNVLKKFRFYYIGAMAHFFAFYIATDNFSDGTMLSNVLIATNIPVPIIIALLMIFGNKENSAMPLKKIAAAIGYLCFAYYITLNIVNAIDCIIHKLSINTMYESLYLGFVPFGGYFIIICSIILPIVRFSQKRSAKLSKA
ncbi:hypothetical protein FMM05_15020 [Flavobacterium zepuense]|uniref:Uncharacterized protein n=1 Tax=Flavobacterium zepuense TaxID=2593302 RepID=A0A552UXQ0_9FLAO|nr:hypothetical protein [Flavobacterium zepuense]TRW23006.1 hypothetical protein FMM05_15020 [Flavobacterium zepuense]